MKRTNCIVPFLLILLLTIHATSDEIGASLGTNLNIYQSSTLDYESTNSDFLIFNPFGISYSKSINDYFNSNFELGFISKRILTEIEANEVLPSGSIRELGILTHESRFNYLNLSIYPAITLQNNSLFGTIGTGFSGDIYLYSFINEFDQRKYTTKLDIAEPIVFSYLINLQFGYKIKDYKIGIKTNIIRTITNTLKTSNENSNHYFLNITNSIFFSIPL